MTLLYVHQKFLSSIKHYHNITATYHHHQSRLAIKNDYLQLIITNNLLPTIHKIQLFIFFPTPPISQFNFNSKCPISSMKKIYSSKSLLVHQWFQMTWTCLAWKDVVEEHSILVQDHHREEKHFGYPIAAHY